MLFALFLEQMLVRQRNRHLRLHLHQLVLHIEDELLEKLFRIFGLVDQIVQIGSKQCAYSFEECHDIFLLLENAGGALSSAPLVGIPPITCRRPPD